MKFRGSDYLVTTVSHAVAQAFIKKHHYAKGCSHTSSLRVGMFRRSDMKLVGAALWMLPPYGVCRKFGLGAKEALCLSRLAVSDEVPTNGASFLIGWCMRYLKAQADYKLLVTYADGYQGHTGTIYRATNWQYDGETEKSYRWVDSDGKLVSKYSTRTIKAAVLDAKYKRLGPFKKHRFIYWL